MTPNKPILTLGFRRDQMYTREKASEDARKGIVMKCATIWGESTEAGPSTNEEERRREEEKPHVVCAPVRE